MNTENNLKLDVNDVGFGMVAAQNDDVALVGGWRNGNSNPGETRAKFMIYDTQIMDQFINEGMGQSDAQKKSESGFVELYVRDTGKAFDVAALVNIEINEGSRGNGLGRKVVQSILDTTESSLNVVDIQKDALSFWNKMGIDNFGTRRNDNSLSFEDASKKSSSSTLFGTIPEGHQIKSPVNDLSFDLSPGM